MKSKHNIKSIEEGNKMKTNRTFLHAWDMVIKNKRAYTMLSVTILLSFTFLLSYLMYIDSNYMTEYGRDIYTDGKIIQAMCPHDGDNVSFDLFLESLKDIENTHYYIWETSVVNQNYYVEGMPRFITILPENVWGVHNDIYTRVFRTTDKEFVLEKNQAIVSTEMYKALKKEFGKEKIIIDFPVQTVDEGAHFLKLEVVDGCYASDIGQSNALDSIYISYDTIRDVDYASDNREALIRSDNPQAVIENMRNLSIAGTSTYENKLSSFVQILNKIQLKHIISIVLFIVLGINLYSSFKNALNDRKFEIGVKRAVGASKKNIIKQFLYEGIIVVVLNLLLAAVLTSIIFIIYKIVMLTVFDKTLVVFISRYSIMIFLIVGVSMTVIFSLLFAIQSSKVEIIRHLKSE
ncbi:MAG: ABC transporter permease [Lachnospiraceae bacterium]|nr:ABC transporter permease [Lachnospiraceae bacterium]